LPIGGLGPVEDDDPAVRIIERVRHGEKNKVAAIVDHEVERSGRHNDGDWIVLAVVRDNANICPTHIGP
jgi:hypothetical protein